LAEYKIPYVVLVSKLVEYFGVDIDRELIEIVKPHHEVIATTFHKIVLKIDDDH